MHPAAAAGAGEEVRAPPRPGWPPPNGVFVSALGACGLWRVCSAPRSVRSVAVAGAEPVLERLGADLFGAARCLGAMRAPAPVRDMASPAVQGTRGGLGHEAGAAPFRQRSVSPFCSACAVGDAAVWPFWVRGQALRSPFGCCCRSAGTAWWTPARLRGPQDSARTGRRVCGFPGPGRRLPFVGPSARERSQSRALGVEHRAHCVRWQHPQQPCRMRKLKQAVRILRMGPQSLLSGCTDLRPVHGRCLGIPEQARAPGLAQETLGRG